MRRLRYICGGEEGRWANGSDVCTFEEAGDVMTPEEGTAGRILSGAGAPLTSWSSLASDIVIEESTMDEGRLLLVSAML